MTLAAEFSTVVSLVSITLVPLGNTHLSPELDKIYFLKADSTSPFPKKDPKPGEMIMKHITTINGAKLPHFYQVGLWNYCEGYQDTGITYYSKPVITNSVNPVEVVISKALPVGYGKLLLPAWL